MVTPAQTATLKRLIVRSGDGNDLAKRILILLVSASNDFTQQVAVTLFAEENAGYRGEEIDEAAFCIGMMYASSSLTHLNELMALMGANLRFGCRRGHYGEDGVFKDEARFVGSVPVRHTFWLSIYDQGCPASRNLAKASRATLDSIDLSNPEGFYPLGDAVRFLHC